MECVALELLSHDIVFFLFSGREKFNFLSVEDSVFPSLSLFERVVHVFLQNKIKTSNPPRAEYFNSDFLRQRPCPNVGPEGYYRGTVFFSLHLGSKLSTDLH